MVKHQLKYTGQDPKAVCPWRIIFVTLRIHMAH